MKYIVQYSGGLGSFAAAVWALDNYPKQDVYLLFCDTKTEDEDLYRFLRETQKFLGIPITTLADGRNVWELFKDVRYIGNSRRDPCSARLKRDLARQYITNYFPPEDTTLIFGIDWMESHRVKSVVNNWEPYSCMFPLVDDSDFDKNWFKVTVEGWGIKLPRLYDMGFAHNNCGGFCVKAGKAHFLNLLDKMPDRYAYHESKEKEMQDYLGKPYTILTETVKKTKRYLSLRELRERKEEIAATEDGQLDFGGCGCFL